MPGPPELHATVAPLAGLLGTWSGEGNGEYPTIEPFAYLETVTFAHVGKPFLAYQQRTTDALTGLPLHSEAGYLRALGEDRLEFVIAQPSGIVELHAGHWALTPGGALLIELITSAVTVTPTAKRVDAVQRSLRLVGDVLSYTLAMAAVGQPMTHHLAAELHRQVG